MSFLDSFLLIFAILFCVSAQPLKDSDKLTVLKDAPSAEVLFRESQPLTLTCPVEIGLDNVLAYFWFKDGETFEWNTEKDDDDKIPNTLLIPSPNKTTEGVYKCVVITAYGEASQKEYAVKMAYLNAPKYTVLKHKPVEGRPFKLDCSINEAYPKPTIKWVSQSISDSNDSKPILSPRKTLSPDGTLWFSNVTTEDASENQKYVCLAESPAVDTPTVLAEHIIEGVEKDKEPSKELVPQYLSKDMVAKVGDVTMIYCIFGGTPLAYPDWKKDGTSVNNRAGDRVTRHNRTGGKRLLITRTEVEDTGVYTCSADNQAGQPVNHTVRLTVVSAPEIIEKLQQITRVKKGQDVTLSCKVTGEPTPKITWTRNVDVLESHSRLEIKGSQMIIKDVNERYDRGYYGCSAVNEYGNAYAETLLLISES